MSEEKLYAVKNNKGEYLAGDSVFDSDITKASVYSLSKASEVACDERDFGGHVVALIEEPEKVVLSKEQAEIVDAAHNSKRPASYIILKSNDEELLMSAFVNGYTVPKEKRYLVELDGLVTTDGAKQYLTKKYGKWFACRRMPGMHQDFTGEELNEAPDWARQLSREEVTDDDND